MSNYSRSLSLLALLGSLAMVPGKPRDYATGPDHNPCRLHPHRKCCEGKGWGCGDGQDHAGGCAAERRSIPKGSLVIGHIVEARPFKFDDTPYAVQQASYLSIKIDQVVNKSGASSVATSVRAMADPISVQEALSPHGVDETDYPGTVTLVGGAHYSPVDKHVTDGPDDDIVAYNKKQGSLRIFFPEVRLPGNPDRAVGGSILPRRLRPLWFRSGSSIRGQRKRHLPLSLNPPHGRPLCRQRSPAPGAIGGLRKLQIPPLRSG